MRTIKTIDLADALKLQSYILAVAASDGLAPIAICIVDATGKQLCAAVMDGCEEASIKTAHDKAVTAVKFLRDTIDFRFEEQAEGWSRDGEDLWSEEDIAYAIKINDIFCPWGGGCLIPSLTDDMHDGPFVGAIGISGRSEFEDHDLANTQCEI